jgi:hypothetical protein
MAPEEVVDDEGGDDHDQEAADGAIEAEASSVAVPAGHG